MHIIKDALNFESKPSNTSNVENSTIRIMSGMIMEVCHHVCMKR